MTEANLNDMKLHRGANMQQQTVRRGDKTNI